MSPSDPTRPDAEQPDESGDGLDTARPASGRGTLLLGLVVAVVLVVGIGAYVVLADDPTGLPASGTPEDARALVGQPLPELTIDGFDGGEKVRLADYRGRPLVVNMWATWCAPCVAEMPDFAELASELGDQVAFVGVDTMDAPAAAKAFVDELGIPYDLAADPQARLFGAIGGFGMPTTLLVDSDGTIVESHTGPYDREGLRAALKEHLGVGA